MKKKYYLLPLSMLIASIQLLAQSFEQVYPHPQKIVNTTHSVSKQQQQGTATISIPTAVKYHCTPTVSNLAAMQHLKKIFGEYSKHAKTTMCLGIRGDKSIKKYNAQIPNKPNGYYIKVSKQQIVIAANDQTGLLYGIQTLIQSVGNKQLPLGEVTDYPDVAYRGVVEGFYGTPWSFEDRMSQLDFYGKHKLNVYIYGPKDDPYHSTPHWRKPYPQKQAKQLSLLVQKAKDNGVIFYWAIHPGQDIKWNKEDRDLVFQKFETMYQLGVRAFAVFFDDISGDGTQADKQANLLNDLNQNFVKVKGDVAPLIICPTEYNKSWANIAKGYLPTLGKKLSKDIHIMWTGNSVVSCIKKEDLQWINKYLQRPAYIWWNFPVSDFVRDHLLLGAVYGNDADIANQMSGFLSNPMEHAEASKIALSGVADYAWNMKNFDSDKSWNHAINELLPQAAQALKTFASHNSDLGANGHQFRRNESVAMQPFFKQLQVSKGADNKAWQMVMNESKRLQAACDILLAQSTHPALINEMRPWIKMGKLLGEYSEQVLTLYQLGEQNNTQRFYHVYQHICALQTLMYQLDCTENQNPYQPGIKVGSLIFKPTIDQLFVATIQTFNKKHATQLKAATQFVPFSIESNVPQLAHLGTRTKGKTLIVNPSNEVIQWKQHQYLTLNFTTPMLLKHISIDLGTLNISSIFTFEVQQNGEWIQLPLIQQSGKTNIQVQQLPNLPIAAIRFVQSKKPNAEVYFKGFQVTQQ